MRQLFRALVALLLSAGLAAAADLPLRAPPPPVNVAAVDPTPWTSVHIGVNGGGTWSISPFVETSSSAVKRFSGGSMYVTGMIVDAAVVEAQPISTRNDSPVIGGQVGMDWQVSKFVIGAEADFDVLTTKTRSGGAVSSLPVPGGGGGLLGSSMTEQSITHASRTLDYLATFRARMGVLAKPNLLVYGTAGLAVGHASGEYSVLHQITVPPMWKVADRPWGGHTSFSKTMIGWAAGGGVEWMFYKGFSLKAEYLYYSLGSVTMPGWGNKDPTGIMVGPEWYMAGNARTRVAGHMAKAGLNYYFGLAGPSSYFRR